MTIPYTSSLVIVAPNGRTKYLFEEIPSGNTWRCGDQANRDIVHRRGDRFFTII
jgi:hypothetical protein